MWLQCFAAAPFPATPSPSPAQSVQSQSSWVKPRPCWAWPKSPSSVLLLQLCSRYSMALECTGHKGKQGHTAVLPRRGIEGMLCFICKISKPYWAAKLPPHSTPVPASSCKHCQEPAVSRTLRVGECHQEGTHSAGLFSPRKGLEVTGQISDSTSSVLSSESEGNKVRTDGKGNQ